MRIKIQAVKQIGTVATIVGVALAALPVPFLLSQEAAAQDQTQPAQAQQGQAQAGQTQPGQTQPGQTQPGQAQQDQTPLGDGLLNATAYQTIAAGSAFDTVVQDPTDASRSVLESAAVDRINSELANAGYRVSRDTDLVMLVGTDLIRGTSKEATIDEFRGTGDTGFTYQHNLYSNNKRSLLNKPDPSTAPNTFRISLSVYDRKTGLYIWRGSIDRGTSDLTPDKAADRMIPAIVAAIGKTVKNQSVPLGHD